MARHDLTLDTTAVALGLSRRMLAYYTKQSRAPSDVPPTWIATLRSR